MAAVESMIHRDSTNATQKIPVSANDGLSTLPTSETLAPRTISELIARRAQQAPHQPILGYPSHGVEYVEYTFEQLDRLADAGASHYAARVPTRSSSEDPEVVVAILGHSTLEYLITIIALSRLGFTVLFLSTRISEEAYISLLESTNSSHLIVHSSFQKTVAGIKNILPQLEVVSILDRSDFDNENTAHFNTNQYLNPDEESTKTSWIIHSSGSTGLPKPIYQTHQAALRNYESNMGMEGFITLPLFHAHGLSSVFRGITAYKKIYMYNASLPLTSPNLLSIMRQHRFEIFYGVPYALKLLSESKEGIEALASMKIVMFGGSACPDGLGDLLVENGVNLISHYGTTETGQLMTSFRPPGDKAWNYVRVHQALEPYVRFEDRGGHLFELVVLEGWPSKVATNRDDGAYATKDLFEPHPSIPNAWKYGGRLDDTIVLVNGEKAIPLAMEGAVRQQKLVKDAVVFGTGRPSLGMMIIRSDMAASYSQEELISQVWPTIEVENSRSPSYAQLSPQSILVLPPDTIYPQTDKGTLIRQAFYKAFATDIEQFYARLEARSTGTLDLSGEALCDYLRSEVLRLIPGLRDDELNNDTDLFSLGVDSLQSSRLRGTILASVQLNSHSLSQNFVFENPTISGLADAIVAVRSGASTALRNVEQEMEDLVIKYGEFPQHKPQKRKSNNTCVIVTGATGSLGAHIVAQLVSRDDFSEVCCLVRARTAEAAIDRVWTSLNHRGILSSIPSHLRTKISAYSSDFSKSDLGLETEVYDRLAQDVVSIIHCAWSVNFNTTLASFEKGCIAGAKNLILLCLNAIQPTPASFNFCSSVSTVARTPFHESAPESIPANYGYVQRMGYAQSKLVTEKLVVQATSRTSICARVLRIGQIVADTVHGIWNDTEAIPLMLQTAVTLGTLPSLNESCRWLPVDIVATAILDASFASTPQIVFNIVNPLAFHWTEDLLPKLKIAGLVFEQVDQREWLRRLRESDPDPSVNPTYKLLEFFTAKYDDGNAEKRGLRYETTAAEGVSPVLAAHPELTQDLVTKFVQHFLSTSWSNSSSPPQETILSY
ncbi:hypothetical protein PV10_08416 [Exophiala mesophila]|uniref:Carrier domain-containing protein n=1 Tax=Exophiala mesophila TaxID=212818 RepID=A0A0D1XKP2_EXOME|nr:uncharacterized protein PV10_08416 [Exophiala mesophila]KIV88771.1 hypothetical protein PV10_08416 [Exophiala mesophila]